MRTLVVGDIHGCYDELLVLLQMARIGPGDGIVSVGDLVDRGPKSWEVVDFFRQHPARRRAVLGNHEEKHLRKIRSDVDDPSGRIVRAATPAAQYAAMLDYFGTLPLYLDLPEALVVHAGFEPGVSIENQPVKIMTGRGSQGRPGFDGKSPPWFDDPRMDMPKPVIFGHLIYPEVVRGARQNVWGIDTGAAVGGSLTGLLLPEFELLHVPTPDYYSEVLRRWRPVFLAEDLPAMPWPRVLALDGGEYPELKGKIESAQQMYRAAMVHLDREVARLIAATGWSRLSDIEKRDCVLRLKKSEEFDSTFGRLLLRCFPSGPTDGALQRTFPTPEIMANELPEDGARRRFF
jgi:Calcineurin-like phosphoesterase